MTDADLTLRLLRKIDSKVDALDAKVTALDAKVDALDTKVDAFEAKFEMRFSVLEHTVNSLAGQMLVFTQYMKKMDLRVRKLEARAR